MERYLVLEDNTVFEGKAFGAITATQGNLKVMTQPQGYQESMTDPAHANSLIIFAFPTIGNTGINFEDEESLNVQCSGIIVSEYVRKPSNWRSQMGIETYMLQQNIPGIYGIDTRKLIAHIRNHGPMSAKLVDKLDDEPQALRQMADISTKSAYRIQGTKSHVTVLDLGINQSTLETLHNYGCRIQVMPYNTNAFEIMATSPDGVYVSNGSLNSDVLESVRDEVQKLIGSVPVFGCGLGAHLVANNIPKEQSFISQGVTSETPQFITSHYGGIHELDDSFMILDKDLNKETILAFKKTYDYAIGVDYVVDSMKHDEVLEIFLEQVESLKENAHETRYK